MSTNVQQRGNRVPADYSRALTFEQFAAMCAAAEEKRGPLPVHIQFRTKGEVLCGLVLDAVPAKGGQTVDFFQVESDVGVQWAAHTRVRACAGVDGRCTCEAGAREKAEGVARPGVAPPLGNTGVEA